MVILTRFSIDFKTLFSWDKKFKIVLDSRHNEFLEEDVVDLRRLTKIHYNEEDEIILNFLFRSSLFGENQAQQESRGQTYSPRP